MNPISQLRLLLQVRRVALDTKEKIVMENQTTGKPLITSKTTWANLLLGAIQVAGILSGYLPEKYVPYTVAFQSVANIVLRLITGEPITGLVKVATVALLARPLV